MLLLIASPIIPPRTPIPYVDVAFPPRDVRMKKECKIELQEGEESPVIVVSIHGQAKILACQRHRDGTLFLWREEHVGGKPTTRYESEDVGLP